MTEKTRYQVLESLPTYGPMYISVTDNDEPFYSEGFVVRFYQADETEWVANFKPGWTDLKKVVELAGTKNLLIIAYGTCYLIDPEQKKPLAVFGVGYLTTLKTEDGRLILQDQTDLTVVEPNGNYWRTERISWDGLKELSLEKNIVTGLAFDPMYDADEWVSFSYNIDTKELIGGSYQRSNSVKKSKWRFW